MAKSARTPWDRPNPRKKKGKASKHLSPANKRAAKASAKRAGRPYPNLVDNMRAASKKKSGKKKSAKKTAKKTKKSSAKRGSKKSAHKKSAKKKKRVVRPAQKDPRGGLTAAGRRAFAEKDGSHLQPGVRKSAAQMTATEMRRKGSWAVRFYGRKHLPPLMDANGNPTRLALSAHAWGEPVPKTIAAARRIAKKGEQLLARYHRARAEKR